MRLDGCTSDVDARRTLWTDARGEYSLLMPAPSTPETRPAACLNVSFTPSWGSGLLALTTNGVEGRFVTSDMPPDTIRVDAILNES